MYRVWLFTNKKLILRSARSRKSTYYLIDPPQNQGFILITKPLNDNVHFSTICRVNISHQIKRKRTVPSQRDQTLVAGGHPLFSRGVGYLTLPFFVILITDAAHVSDVPLSQTLVSFLPRRRCWNRRTQSSQMLTQRSQMLSR